MQHQDSDFLIHTMTEVARLLRRAFHRDGDLAEIFSPVRGWERQNVGGVIPRKKIAIQPSQLAIIGEQAFKPPASRHFGFQPFRKCPNAFPRQAHNSAAE